MIVHQIHRWDVTPAEAIAIQNELRRRVVLGPLARVPRTIAGVDVGVYGGVAWAAIVVLSYPDLVVVDRAMAEMPVTFPYVPGLLAFRESPVVLSAFEKLQTAPDLVIVDGQGMAHPRRFGIACHVGVILDLPTIGCAKSRLVGVHGALPMTAGAWAPLRDRGEVIGAVVRSKAEAAPLYVSIGHRVDVETAVQYVLACCRGQRLPETTRQAHMLAGRRDGTMEM